MFSGHLSPANAPEMLSILEGVSDMSRAKRDDSNAKLKQLKGNVDQQQGLAPLLLMMAMNDQYSEDQRKFCTAAFRDVVKSCWHPQRSEHVIQEGDKQQVRDQLFSAMLGSSPTIRRSLSSCIEMICEVDFPHAYGSILDEMVAVLQRTSPETLADPATCDALEATLTTAHAVFTRYRELFELDEDQAQELITIHNQTADTLIGLLEGTCMAAAGAIEANNLAAAKTYVKLCSLTTEVIHDLTTCDLGDQHERSMGRIAEALMNAMRLESAELLGTKYQGGPLMELRSSVLSLIAHYMAQFDEDMAPYAQRLMETVWNILRAPSSGVPAADDLVVSGIGFFESACRGAHAALLKDVLRDLCQQVALPCLQLTEADIETFEDEPDEYIQRDIEGSDVHTRRHSACKLIRTLLATFPECADLLNECIGGLVSSGKWLDNDSAVVLVTAMGLKAASSVTAMRGNAAMAVAASELTSYVDLAQFYTSHISPLLSTPAPEEGAPGATEAFVLKADALRFVATFRHHLPLDALAAMIPQVAQFIACDNVVVHTYAAHTIERILTIATEGPNAITDEHLSGSAASVLEMLCGRLGKDLKLNHYTVKCLAQVLRAGPNSCQPFTGDVVAVLAGVLQHVAKNPSNPLFHHFLFESMGYTLRLAGENHEQCLAIESLLWEPLFGILQQDVVELLPYALQILALLLDMHPSGSTAHSPAAPVSRNPTADPKVPEHFMALYQPLCSPELFQHKGNVPAAIRLITSYVRKDPEQMNAAGCTAPTLELAARLLHSKLEDHFGFEIIGTVVNHFPRNVLDVQLPTIFRVLFDRMQARPTPKFGRLLALFCAAVLARHGAEYFEQILEGFQQGMTAMVLRQILLPVVGKVTGDLERKTCAVGLSHAIRDSGVLLNAEGGSLWATCVLRCLSLLHLEAEHDDEAAASAAMVDREQHSSVEDLAFAAVEESGVGSKFVQLASAARQPDDPCGTVNDAAALFKQCIKTVVDQHPQEARTLLQANLPPDALNALSGYL